MISEFFLANFSTLGKNKLEKFGYFHSLCKSEKKWKKSKKFEDHKIEKKQHCIQSLYHVI